MNEKSETFIPVSGESVSISGETFSISDYSQTLNSETVASGSSFVTVDNDVVSDIYSDVHIIMVIAILSFAMSCMRGWRKNTLKGC